MKDGWLEVFVVLVLAASAYGVVWNWNRPDNGALYQELERAAEQIRTNRREAGEQLRRLGGE